MNAGTACDQWDVVLVPFPFSDLSGAKQRPALVVSASSFNRVHSDVICCLITSKVVPQAGCPLLAKQDLAHGSLAFDSQIKPHRLFTIEKTLVRKTLGRVNAAKAGETLASLLAVFGVRH